MILNFQVCDFQVQHVGVMWVALLITTVTGRGDGHQSWQVCRCLESWCSSKRLPLRCGQVLKGGLTSIKQ